MLVAHRNGMAVSGGWTNPYVTDGLIAMWDGEWNAGGGVHDANATSWVDLVGGVGNLNFALGGISVGSNNMMTTIGGAYNGFFNFQSPQLSSLWDSVSISGVWKHTITTFTPYRFFGVTPYTSAVETWNSGNEILARYRNARCPVGQPSNDYIGVYYACTMTYDGQSKLGKYYVIRNGEIRVSPNAMGSDNVLTERRMEFMCAAGMQAYRIAIYSRALTAAEIAANYAIDKARFGLP